MSESSEDKQQQRQHSGSRNMSKSVTQCDNKLTCDDETGAEGDGLGNCLVQAVAFRRNERDLSGSRRAGYSGLEGPVDEEYCASSSSFPTPCSSQNHSTCCDFIPGSRVFSDAGRKRASDACVKENGLSEKMKHRMAPPINGCSTTPGNIPFPLAHGFCRNNVQPLSRYLPGTAESSSVSVHSDLLGHNNVGDQIDGGYMEEADAYMESSDGMGAEMVSERGVGVHLSFGMDVGAAGGGSVDDIGDFIDADIPQHHGGSSQFKSRSNDSVMSSFEELTAGVVASERFEMEKVGPYFLQDAASVHDDDVCIAEAVRKRIFGSEVNNLSQAGRAAGGLRNNFTGDFGAVFHQSSHLSQSGSLNFDKDAAGNQGKCWRWSDSDAVSSQLPSLTSATSLTSDLSCGTPSVPLTSPPSTEDEAVASVMSSPECLNQLPLKVDRCSHGPECLVASESLDHDGRDGRDDPWLAESASETYCGCKSCNGLLKNMNQTSSKHVIEKFFAWGTGTNSDRSSTPLWTKHLHNDAPIDYGGDSCRPLGLGRSRDSHRHRSSDCQRMSTSFDGTGITNAESIDSPVNRLLDNAERSRKDASSEESFLAQTNSRRFSCQSLLDADPLDFLSFSSTDNYRRNAQSETVTGALSENSLYSTQFLKSRPVSLQLDSQRTRNCLGGSCMVIRHVNSGCYKTDQPVVGSELSHKKKILACVKSLSLNEEEIDDDFAEGVSCRAHRRNKNGHHCRFGNEMRGTDILWDLTTCDVNLTRPENDILKSGLVVACSACPVSCLLCLLGINDFGPRACDLFPANVLAEKASLPNYLISCSTAGISAEQLISRVSHLTKDLVYGKFFHLYPRRSINLIPWLKFWIRKGAVPLATRKYEHPDSLGDSWQHKLLHGAWKPGLGDDHLSEDVVVDQWFSSDSSMRINRHHVVSRWHDDCDLNVLVSHADTRWHQMNVLGQVVNILREERLQSAVGGYRPQLTSHIVIPTHFKSGITLYIRTDNASYAELESTTPDLPIVEQSNGSADEAVRQTSHDRHTGRTNSTKARIRETMI